MEHPAPITPPPKKESRLRILGQIAIWIAVLLVCVGGFLKWDQRNYSVPYLFARQPSNPFSGYIHKLPPFLESPRLELNKFQRKLRSIRADRIQRKRLKNLIIADSKWHGTPSIYDSFAIEEITIHFKPDGTLEFNKGKFTPNHHEFFSFDRYERDSYDTITFSNPTVSKTYKIYFVDSTNGLTFTELNQWSSLISIQPTDP